MEKDPAMWSRRFAGKVGGILGLSAPKALRAIPEALMRKNFSGR